LLIFVSFFSSATESASPNFRQRSSSTTIGLIESIYFGFSAATIRPNSPLLLLGLVFGPIALSLEAAWEQYFVRSRCHPSPQTNQKTKKQFSFFPIFGFETLMKATTKTTPEFCGSSE
jgi:hypothetical protein